MESDSTLPGLLTAISLVCYSLATLGEVSFASLGRERIQGLIAQGTRRALDLQRLHSTASGSAGMFIPLRFLLFASSLLWAADFAGELSGGGWQAAFAAALGVLILVALVHTSIRSLAAAYGERISLATIRPVLFAARMLEPVLKLRSATLDRLLGSGSTEEDAERQDTPPVINISVDTDGEPLDEREVRMIRGVVRMDTTIAREIMVPRVDIVAAEVGTSLAALAAQMVAHGHSRVPIYEGSVDQIKGIAYARDILDQLSSNQDAPKAVVADVVRPALFIPESKTLEGLLTEFQERQVHIAIVIDEYGGVSGLVTIEDLLEEIVGEIKDEFEVGEPEIQSLGAHEYLVDAGVSIDQLGQLMNVTVDGDGFDTVGGFVYKRLGKIPSSGDSVEYDGLRVVVVSTIGRRLKRLRVTRSTLS